MTTFNYATEAELFPSRVRQRGRSGMKYRRFGSAADAIRFAVEELPPQFLVGACLEVDGRRFNGEEIRRLYESPDYPLERIRNDAVAAAVA